jgi:hypothetical protein
MLTLTVLVFCIHTENKKWKSKIQDNGFNLLSFKYRYNASTIDIGRILTVILISVSDNHRYKMFH